MTPDPHHTADAQAIAHARAILGAARDAVLAVLDAQGWPMTSRIALQTDDAGQPLAMLSGLALHKSALRADPRAALLIDEAPEERGRGMALTRARHKLILLSDLRSLRAHPRFAALEAFCRDLYPDGAGVIT